MNRPYLVLLKECCDQYSYRSVFTSNPLVVKEALKQIEDGECEGFVFSVDTLERVTEIKISVNTTVEVPDNGDDA